MIYITFKGLLICYHLSFMKIFFILLRNLKCWSDMNFFSRIVFVIVFVAAITTPAMAQNDKDAIKMVIEQETAAFMNVDYKTWSGLWLKAPYAYWSFSDSSGTSYIEGWDNLDKTYQDYFKNSRPSKAEITNEWIEIRVYENGAYAHFIQKAQDDIDLDETSQVRILEKKDGKWKVVCVGAIARYQH